MSWLRVRLRTLLRTLSAEDLPDIETAAPQFAAAADQVLAALAQTLHAHQNTHLLLGFPAAPFVLALRAEDKAAFRAFAAKQPPGAHPAHQR
ncbi:hypothetical protein [Actinospica robiniae]|uniref:hypothetical protein n=1 Tax=Actinospica robiniae TaxID=304901 RepID=UPI0004239E64|nr:hypothetical protein [Actinospica robiniae]